MLGKNLVLAIILVFAILAIFGESAVAQGIPSVSSVSGTVADGESVSISGSRFGTTGPTIYKWDDFEEPTHVVGQNVGAGPGTIAWSMTNSNNPSKIDNTDNRDGSTKYANTNYYYGECPSCYKGGITMNYDGAIPSPVYLTWYWRYDSNAGEVPHSSNSKFWPIADDDTDDGCGPPGCPRVGTTLWNGGFPGSNYVYASDDARGTIFQEYITIPSEAEWLRWEFYGVESSGGETADGTIYYAGQIDSSDTFTLFKNLEGNTKTRLSYHWSKTLFAEFAGMSEETTDFDWDYDDIYIANSRARVELGDNSNWDLCTHREIQIPTAWSDGSITITANQGSFQQGETAYLFVVDENGNVSNGRPITIGGVSNCGNSQCDAGECDICPGDCTLGQCCGIEGCNSPVGEDCGTCPQDCGCTSPEICCSDQCVVPACYQDSDCGSNTCKAYTCNNPGTCSASCSEQDITSCINDDGCCSLGCTEQDDNDCMAADYCNGLSLLMHLDNQAGYGESPTHVYDFSGNGNNGTVTGAIHNSSAGKFDGAFEFDGNDDYITINHDSTLDMTDELTLAAWVYPTSITDYDYIISRASNTSGSPYIFYALGFDSSTGRLRIRVFTDSGYQAVSQVIYPEQWYHVAGTYSASQNNLSIYINGILADSVYASGPISVNDKGVLIGGYEYGPGESWNGYIDEIAVWNRALSAQEVQGLYNSGVPVTCFHRADTNKDGCIVMQELLAFIDRWKVSSQDVPMREMMEAIGLWKQGTVCQE